MTKPEGQYYTTPEEWLNACLDVLNLHPNPVATQHIRDLFAAQQARILYAERDASSRLKEAEYAERRLKEAEIERDRLLEVLESLGHTQFSGEET